MESVNWIEEFPCAVTVCDVDGIILRMNARAAQTFQADGGAALVGRNVLDCHPPAARARLQEMLHSRTMNAYTIEKNGVKKLIYQSPWFENGEYKGFVEISLPLPAVLPHFVRT